MGHGIAVPLGAPPPLRGVLPLREGVGFADSGAAVPPVGRHPLLLTPYYSLLTTYYPYSSPPTPTFPILLYICIYVLFFVAETGKIPHLQQHLFRQIRNKCEFLPFLSSSGKGSFCAYCPMGLFHIFHANWYFVEIFLHRYNILLIFGNKIPHLRAEFFLPTKIFP